MGDFDNEANNRNNQGQGAARGGQGLEVPEFLNAFRMGGNYNADPRKEGFCEMLKNNLTAPGFGIKWFIAIVSIVDILGYLITLIGSFFTAHPGLSNNVFLGVNQEVLELWER